MVGSEPSCSYNASILGPLSLTMARKQSRDVLPVTQKDGTHGTYMGDQRTAHGVSFLLCHMGPGV